MRRRGFVRAEQGNLATMAALLSPLVIVLGAVGIDAASLYLERRQAQAVADVAAIAAARQPARGVALTAASFADNGIAVTPSSGRQVVVTQGRYDPSAPEGLRFVPGAVPANAVDVFYRHPGTRHFGTSLIPAPLIAVRATAAQTPRAAFSIGTRLAKLDGGLANTVLGPLLGANLSLTALDYESVLATRVSLFSFLDALAVTTDSRALTYSELGRADVTVGQIAKAVASVDALAPAAVKLAKQVAAGMAAAGLEVPLARLLALDASAGSGAVGSGGHGVSAAVGVLDLLTASAGLANGSRQIDIVLGTAIPGVLSADLSLATGEPMNSSPWLSYGEIGTTIRTAQTRLALTLRIAPANGLLGTEVKLPLIVELASAEARLSAVSCPTGRVESGTVDIAATPAIAEAMIGSFAPGTLADFKRRPTLGAATMVKAPLVAISGKAALPLGNVSARTVSFSAAQIAAHTVKSVSTTTPVTALTKGLVSNLNLDVSVAGLDVGISSLARTALGATLTPLAPAIDTLLFSILGALGITLGEADLRVDGIDCGRPVLVR